MVTSVPDEKKGERLVVLCQKDVDIKNVVEKLKKSDLPNLWIPDEKCFMAVEYIPMLGTGKMDLKAIKQKGNEIFSER